MKLNNKGYILGTSLVIAGLVLVVAAGLFQLINTQRKLSLKKELLLQAYNAAETSIDYAYSPIVNDINVNTIASASTLPSGTATYKEFTFKTSVNDYLAGSPTMDTGYTGKINQIAYGDRTVRVLAAGANKRYYVDGADPANSGSPILNQWVNERLIPVVARVTATQSGKSFTAFVQKSIASQEISLFQYAIFFQGQLHMHRGFRPMGEVHTNGNLFLNAQSGDTATYNGAVSATGRIYRGSTFDVGGTGSDGYGYVPVDANGDADFDIARSPVVAPSQTGSSLKILKSNTTGTYVHFANNKDYKNNPSGWKKWATDNYGTNLQDKSHDVPSITLVGAAGYDQDVVSTTGVNEFNNGPYKLIEPTFPKKPASGTDDYANIRMTSNLNNLEANASLILIVEYNSGPCDAAGTLLYADSDSRAQITLHRTDNGEAVVVGNGKVFTAAASGGDAVGAWPTLSLYSDPWRMFVVKGYRVKGTWDPASKTETDVHDFLTKITLPDKVIGAANAGVTAITTNLKMEDFNVALSSGGTGSLVLASTMATPIATLSTTDRAKIDSNNQVVQITTGLFDSRLGRGVTPLTIDIDALKDVLEAPIANFTNPSNNLTFRTDFDPTVATTTAGNKKWNGLVYVEFPTSLVVDTAGATNVKNAIKTLRFTYSSTPETRHPDRSVETGDTRSNRSDNIVPIAPELRRYPSSFTNPNAAILDAQYAIPAVQLINGRYLPSPNKGSNTTSNIEGFTVATNVPVYTVGSYNSDGNYATGSNIDSDTPGDVAETETGEIPAAIFCDMYTVLSAGWGVGNRLNSFYGKNNGSTASNTAPGKISGPTGRPAKSLAGRTIMHFKKDATSPEGSAPFSYPYPDSNPDLTKPYVEISACIATGEYPIFEFFTHALENYSPLYSAMSTTKANPIIFKGSVVGMFHSEIQHIKQAYGRSVSDNVQSGNIWQQHGAYAIAGTRFHELLVNGNFPPGTPKAYVTTQREFSLLHWNDTTDAAVLTNAGFTAP